MVHKEGDRPAFECKIAQGTKGRGVGDPPPPSTTPETVEHPSGSYPGWEQPLWISCIFAYGTTKLLNPPN